MTEEKKALYRELLRWAMIDMRMHSAGASRNTLSLFWRRGRSHRESLRFVNALADWLHNAALYATMDFAGFDETLFWQNYTRFRSRFPADRWAGLTESVVAELRALND